MKEIQDILKDLGKLHKREVENYFRSLHSIMSAYYHKKEYNGDISEEFARLIVLFEDMFDNYQDLIDDINKLHTEERLFGIE